MAKRERALPHNLDAERSVLGAVLIDNDAIIPAAETLTPDDFYGEVQKALYAVAKRWGSHKAKTETISRICSA